MPPKRSRKRLLGNIRFLQKRHKNVGFDSDYCDKLSDDELDFFERAMRAWYQGEGEEDPVLKKERNHARYMANRADAISRSTPIEDVDESDLPIDSLDPEKILLLKESMRLRLADGEDD